MKGWSKDFQPEELVVWQEERLFSFSSEQWILRNPCWLGWSKFYLKGYKKREFPRLAATAVLDLRVAARASRRRSACHLPTGRA